MATKVKCLHCEKSVDKDNCTQVKSKRYVCNACLTDYLKAESEKNNVEKIKNIETQAYKDLIEYICDLYNIKAPTMVMVTQIKRFKEENNYTYQGMKATLEYFYILQNHSVEDSMGVGIIPYVYNETRLFYEEQREMKERLKDYDYKTASQNIKIVTVQQSEVDKYKDMHLIPLEDIQEENETEEF